MHYNSVDFFYNSRLMRFRNPAGAIACGSELTISARIGRKLLNSFVLLCVNNQGRETHYLMEHVSPNTLSFTFRVPEKPGLIYYYFIINDKKTLYYYGGNSGIGNFYEFERVPHYQITLFEPDFKTPDWFKKTIMYQIFPDHFFSASKTSLAERANYHASKGRPVYLHENWDEQPLYLPVEGAQDYNPCDFFGGDLPGITAKLQYLKSLGVGCIYLNPIFESPSNHRYDCSDYKKVDPILGTEHDFDMFCKAAHDLDIHIILDGVFSHTGDDSVYFNKNQRYDSIGAYQSVESPYFGWYVFNHFPHIYKSWWGFKTLPETDETNPAFEDFIVTGEDAVIKHWMHKGTSGWRFDVADELPDEFIALMRKHIKSVKPDAILLGEVWEDASNKYSMNTMRAYVFGNELDSVMNYPWRNTVIRFLLSKINAFGANHEFGQLREHYPQEFYYSCMNLLSSHDVPRILSLLGGAPDKDSGYSRAQQSLFALNPGMRILAKQRLALAVVFQMMMPGVPSIYYGDEAGVEGLMDPFNRGTYPWENQDQEILNMYGRLSRIRSKNVALQTGGLIISPLQEDVLCIIRFTANQQDAFGQPAQDDIVISLINRNATRSQFLKLNLKQEFEGPDAPTFISKDGRYTDVLDPKNTVDCKNGKISLTIAPLSFCIYQQAKNLSAN